MSRGRTEEAKEALVWLRGPGTRADDEYRAMCKADEGEDEDDTASDSVWQSVRRPSVWKPFLILLAFFALQQLTGIYVVLFYAVSLLRDIGVSMNQYVGSVGIGAVRLCASVLGAGLAHHVDR